MFAGVLCGPVVPGRVLVLLCVHPHDVDHVRVHPRAAAAQEHGRDQEDGQQALHDTGQPNEDPDPARFSPSCRSCPIFNSG